MDSPGDGTQLAESLGDALAAVRFTDRSADEVTALLVDAVVAWGSAQGWRVYRRARSVMRLPPPYEDRHSWVDVGCARVDRPSIVVEVDRSDRKRTIDKLLAEAQAGRIALWVRWGPGPFAAAPPPIHVVTCTVAVRKGRHSRPSGDRPAPAHSDVDLGSAADQADLFNGLNS